MHSFMRKDVVMKLPARIVRARKDSIDKFYYRDNLFKGVNYKANILMKECVGDFYMREIECSLGILLCLLYEIHLKCKQ